jgi:hypothetical protein
VQLVVDYFRWRSEDASRNALNAYCYWTLRKSGLDEQSATRRLNGLSIAAKNELLFQLGINFNDLPAWQKRGIGLYWEEYDKPALNPRTGEQTSTVRRRVARNFELPMKEEYGGFIQRFLTGANDVGSAEQPGLAAIRAAVRSGRPRRRRARLAGCCARSATTACSSSRT